MDLLYAIILGLIQGFTEWLPISSSGHLVIAQTLLGLDVPAEFDIVIMIGTIMALLIYLRERIFWIIKGLLAKDQKAWNYACLMVIAGVFTAILGFAGEGFFKGLFAKPFVVSLLIIVTGLFLFIVSRCNPKKTNLGIKEAAIIGIAQGIAVAPGISRSGSTIGTGMLLGIEAKEAAEFSFLIGAPAMVVASLLEFADARMVGLDLSIILAGIIAAFIAGYLSIGFFMEILKRGKLSWFSYYCIIAGSVFAVLSVGII
jgi:undecaprenyl-diphosphatase